MVKLKLVPYKLKIKDLDKSRKGKPIYLDLAQNNFEGYFQEFIKDHKEITIDSGNETIFNCSDIDFNKNDSVYYGILGSGGYGYSAPFFDVNTKKQSGERRVNDAEQIKFYYLLKIFNDEAFLLLTQFKLNGIKTNFHKHLNKYIRGKNVFSSKFNILINNLVSSKLIEGQKLQEIEFIRTRNSRDIESQIINKGKNKENEKISERKIFSFRGSQITRTKQIVENLIKNFKEKEYIEIDKEEFEKINLKVIMPDRTSKTIHLDSEISYVESLLEDFRGDFPSLKDFYKIAKPYLIKVIKGNRD